MLYRLAFAYAHVFLFEFMRQRERDLYYPDNYLEVVKSVIEYGNLPLGYGYERVGVVRSGTGWETHILERLHWRLEAEDRIRLRDVVKLVLNETLLYLDTSPYNKPKRVGKAVDSAIPAEL